MHVYVQVVSRVAFLGVGEVRAGFDLRDDEWFEWGEFFCTMLKPTWESSSHPTRFAGVSTDTVTALTNFLRVHSLLQERFLNAADFLKLAVERWRTLLSGHSKKVTKEKDRLRLLVVGIGYGRDVSPLLTAVKNASGELWDDQVGPFIVDILRNGLTVDQQMVEGLLVGNQLSGSQPQPPGKSWKYRVEAFGYCHWTEVESFQRTYRALRDLSLGKPAPSFCVALHDPSSRPLVLALECAVVRTCEERTWNVYEVLPQLVTDWWAPTMDLRAARDMSEAEAAEEVDILFRLGVRPDVVQKLLPELESFCYDSGAAAAVCRWVDENDGSLGLFFDQRTLTALEAGDPSDVIRQLVEGVNDAVWQSRTQCATSSIADQLANVLESVQPGSCGSIGEGSSVRAVWVAPNASTDETVRFIDNIVQGLDDADCVAWAHAGALERVGLAAADPVALVRMGVSQRADEGSNVDFCRYGLHFSSAKAIHVAVVHASNRATQTGLCAIMLCGHIEDAVGADQHWLDLGSSEAGAGTGPHRFNPPPLPSPCAEWYSLVLLNRFPAAPDKALHEKMAKLHLTLQTDVKARAENAVVIYGAQAACLNLVTKMKVRLLQEAVTDQLVVKTDESNDERLIEATKLFQVVFIVWKKLPASEQAG